MNAPIAPDSVSVRSQLAHGGHFDLRLSGDGTVHVFLASHAPLEAVRDELDAVRAALSSAASVQPVGGAS